MTAHVSSPDGMGNRTPVKALGYASYANVGTFTVTPPSGTKYVRGLLRGGSGGGGGFQLALSGGQGGGGGQGATWRFFVAQTGPFSVTVGDGGAPGSNGTGAACTSGSDGVPTTCLGKTANAGQGGTHADQFGNVGGGSGGGSGVDGNDNTSGLGYGNFNGNPGSSLWLGGAGTQAGPGSGGGGAGNSSSFAQKGGKGWANFEFFG